MVPPAPRVRVRRRFTKFLYCLICVCLLTPPFNLFTPHWPGDPPAIPRWPQPPAVPPPPWLFTVHAHTPSFFRDCFATTARLPAYAIATLMTKLTHHTQRPSPRFAPFDTATNKGGRHLIVQLTAPLPPQPARRPPRPRRAFGSQTLTDSLSALARVKMQWPIFTGGAAKGKGPSKTAVQYLHTQERRAVLIRVTAGPLEAQGAGASPSHSLTQGSSS